MYKNIDWSALKGKVVGVMDLVPVPGSTRWTDPLRSCIKAHGGTTLDVDVNGDVTKVPGVLQGWLSQGVSAMAELGVGLSGYQSVLDEAKSKGVPIITYGFGSTPGTISVAPDQILDGHLMADHIISAVPNGGTVLSLRNDTNPGLKQRADGFKQEMSTHPAFKIVEKQVSQLTSQAANQLVTQFLQSNPGTIGIMGGFGDWALGASAAVRQAKSKAIVVSANGDPTEYAEMASPNSPLVMTAADSHEASAELACETIAVILGGGQAFGTSALFSSIAITKANLPADLKVDTTPRTVTEGG